MEILEINLITEQLVENGFKRIKPSEDFELLKNYLTAAEIARKLDVRLDSDLINEALVALGYKTFINKVGVPTNPDNSAFVVKMFEDEDTEEKKYYIQCLWDKSELPNINNLTMNNPYFQESKKDLEIRNKEYTNTLLKQFKNLDDFVVLSVKKTGFNPKKDFILYISYSLYSKQNGYQKSGHILVNDDLDDEKTDHYLKKNEISDMAPFDYIKIAIPTMDDCQFRNMFLDRLVALRELYKIIKGKNVIFYDKNEEVFINKMFENENIPKENSFESITYERLYFKDLIDWVESKQSFKLKDVAYRYSVQINNSAGFSKESLMLNECIEKVLKKY